MSDLPRILLCSFDVIPGPSSNSRRVTEYVKGLSDRFQVVVLSVKTSEHSHIERYHGARLLRVPVGVGDLGSRLMAFDRAVRRQLESEEYVLVHFTDPHGGYALCERRPEFGFRLVYEALGFPSQELRYTHPQTEGDRRFLAKVRRQELFCLMNADRVLTGSEATKQFIQSIGVAGEQIRVIRPPVDLSKFPLDQLAPPDRTPMTVVYVGSQVGYQGLPSLLRALHLAIAKAPMKLKLIGPRHPDWQTHLDDLVSELGLGSAVEFQPPVGSDDLFKVLSTGDVGVVPLDNVERNRRQGGALAKLSDYLAAGRPVIAADLPATREVLPTSAGTFFPPGDVERLAERLVELALSPSRRVELGAAGRRVAEERFDAALIRGQLIDLYDELLGRVEEAPQEPPRETPTHTGTPTKRVLETERLTEDAPVPKTDPAIAGSGRSGARGERSASALGEFDADPTEAIDLPIVLGTEILEPGEGSSTTTEPFSAPPSAPPLVMGLPLDNTDAAADVGPATTAPPMEPWFAQLAHGYCPPDTGSETDASYSGPTLVGDARPPPT